MVLSFFILLVCSCTIHMFILPPLFPPSLHYQIPKDDCVHKDKHFVENRKKKGRAQVDGQGNTVSKQNAKTPHFTKMTKLKSVHFIQTKPLPHSPQPPISNSHITSVSQRTHP